MKWILAAGAILVAVVAVVAIIGAFLPRKHVATRSRRIPAPPEEVFAFLCDVAAFPTWRRHVGSVDVLEGTPLRWRERGRNGNILFARDTEERPTRIVTRIADDALPFGGTWTYELIPDVDGTRVTITENGDVKAPIFRFVSTFILGHASTIETFLDDLAKAPIGPRRR